MPMPFYMTEHIREFPTLNSADITTTTATTEELEWMISLNDFSNFL